MKIAGLDVGTSGCKITVFDENGRQLDRAYQPYQVRRGVGGHEIDPTALMDSVYKVIAEVADKYDDIVGIGVASFGESFVCLDENDNPLANIILYSDPRGAQECRWIVDKVGKKRIAELTGVVAHEMYSLPKIMWLKNNRSRKFALTKKILLVEDYVVYSLTGNAIIDYALAARSMAFDINSLDWNEEILDAAGIDKSLFSKPVPSGTDAGEITEKTAQKTGLLKSTHIIAASHDQIVAAIGSGAFKKDVAVDGAGTVQCYTPIFEGVPDVDVMMSGNYVIVPYVIPGEYTTIAFSHMGGALLQWCTDYVAKYEKEQAKSVGISVNELLETQYSRKRQDEGLDEDGPSGMLVLPHFAGAALPYNDTGSKGAIIGMTAETSPADIYRGCMEGVCYEMYLNYSNLIKAGAVPKKLHATGGGAKSPVWMQMKADVLGVPIVALKSVDAGTVGSAMLTGIALGIFDNLEQAAKIMVEEITTYEPRAYYHEEYMKIYEKYSKVYDAVRSLV